MGTQLASRLDGVPDADSTLATLNRLILEWGNTVHGLPVTPQFSREAIEKRLETYDFSQPRDLGELVVEVAELLQSGSVHVTHPRYFGLFNSNVRRAGVIGDALAAVFNPQLGAWWHGPAANELEALTLDYLRRRIGFNSPDAMSTFTTGGSEANLTGVLAALASAFPAHLRDGLAALGLSPVLYVSDQAHDSFVKIARVTGLGERAVRRVRSDHRQRLDMTALREAVNEDRVNGRSPFLVVATIGTTATGAIDPISDLAQYCRSEGLWLHADAAWGGLAVLSDVLRPHVAGLELADSITWDAHKTLPVPMGAGMFFCRSRRYTEATFAVHTGYVPASEPGVENPYQQTLQWSRRFIGLKIFLTLAELGTTGIATVVEHQAAMAQRLRERLVASGWMVMNDSPLPLVCFTRAQLTSGHTTALARAVVDEGVAWISEVHLPDGSHWLRACITNHDTQAQDVDALVAALMRARQQSGE